MADCGCSVDRSASVVFIGSGGLESLRLGVEAAAGGELVVGADFDELSVSEHDDEIGHADGGEAV